MKLRFFLILHLPLLLASCGDGRDDAKSAKSTDPMNENEADFVHERGIELGMKFDEVCELIGIAKDDLVIGYTMADPPKMPHDKKKRLVTKSINLESNHRISLGFNYQDILVEIVRFEWLFEPDLSLPGVR